MPAGYSSPQPAAIDNDVNALVGKGKLQKRGSLIKVGISTPESWVAADTEIEPVGGGDKGSNQRIANLRLTRVGPL